MTYEDKHQFIKAVVQECGVNYPFRISFCTAAFDFGRIFSTQTNIHTYYYKYKVIDNLFLSVMIVSKIVKKLWILVWGRTYEQSACYERHCK